MSYRNLLPTRATRHTGYQGRLLVALDTRFSRCLWRISARPIVGGMVALLLMLLLPSTSYAHASLVRSTPAPGAVLERAPAEIVLEFTEEVEPRSIHIQLLDAAGTVLSSESPQIDPATPKITQLALSPLEDGAYSWFAQMI